MIMKLFFIFLFLFANVYANEWLLKPGLGTKLAQCAELGAIPKNTVGVDKAAVRAFYKGCKDAKAAALQIEKQIIAKLSKATNPKLLASCKEDLIKAIGIKPTTSKQALRLWHQKYKSYILSYETRDFKMATKCKFLLIPFILGEI